MGKHKPRHQRRDLLQAVYDNAPDLPARLQVFVDAGVDLSHVTSHGESALRVASNNGRFDAVRLLLEAGADDRQLEWTPSFHQVAFGDLAGIRASLADHHDLEARDFWRRTPWLLAILSGDIDKVALLLDLGADADAVGRCGKPPLAYAIQRGDGAMLQWLIDQGLDIETEDDFQATVLISAAEIGSADCVRRLIEAGADIHHRDHIPQHAIEVAASREVVDLLVAAGADIVDISAEMHAELLGIGFDDEPEFSRQDYLAGSRRRFGGRNPEAVQVPFWTAMIRSGAGAWAARSRHADIDPQQRHPVWSYQRFGRSTTFLDDGRIIEIGGEHEDHYDPDFCIYNDVTVFHPDGRIETTIYPEEVFSPTDFHSATRVGGRAGGRIVIIGCLGYPEHRAPGTTPVYTLDLGSLRIERVETSGDKPGWISAHRARLNGDSTIIIEGGQLITAAGALCGNERRYRLSLTDWAWRRDE